MPLRGTTESLAALYDVALLDLDGVVYLGGSPIPGAADALAKAAASGMRLAFVTNNASRTPSAIAAQLTGLGVPARADEVITSAQAAARLSTCPQARPCSWSAAWACASPCGRGGSAR
jgi:glycerol 3-phosphatase-2